MAHVIRSGLLSFVLVLLTTWQAEAQGAVTTCINVVGAGADVADLARLVHHELTRHPNFAPSHDACRTELTVERIHVQGKVFLTGRLWSQVPHRVLVRDDRVDLALTELLRVVLGQDPLSLTDPAARAELFRSPLGPKRGSHGLWGLALGQNLSFLPGRPQVMPSASVSYHREHGPWQLGAHVDVATWLSSDESRLHPKLSLAVVPELARFSSLRANTAAFVTLGLGLMHQRVQGPVRGEEGLTRTSFETGAVLCARVGVELFRSSQTRGRLFMEGVLPAFVARDAQRDVIDAWVPMLSAYAGLTL